MKNTIIVLIVVILAGVGGYFLIQNFSNTTDVVQEDDATDTTLPQDSGQVNETEDQIDEGKSIIGISAGGREITAYHYGEGETEILFVGGTHGGYSWNTALVAFELVDYLEGNPDVVPGNVKVTVIPVLNPDGLNKVVGTADRFSKAEVPLDKTVPGRFNAHEVDLNRNFDCDWQAEATWQNTPVSGGSEVFSEPESRAVRDYVETNSPDAVVVWYSAAGGVFSSSCHNGVLSETRSITNVYADASGYPAHEDFDFYEVTGDMVNWLAKNDIPAISVLLSTHEVVEWDKNKKGIDALLQHYTQ